MVLSLSRRAFLVSSALAAGALAWPLSRAGAQQRVNHALLVAVSDYPNLPRAAWLTGPRNDARLVKEFLTTRAPVPFEPQNVTVLADGLEDAREPTLAAITSELAALAERVGDGDFVYLQFSGHGSQQPERVAGSEASGFDQIFLSADTERWIDKSRGVPNALVDDDIGEALAAIRAKGAFIWVVFDCCHSGTATRAASVVEDDVTERKIDPADLGIPEEEMMEAAGSASRGIGEETDERVAPFTLTPQSAEALLPGGMVAFFAAQNVETTPELKLPRGNPESDKLGLFTYTIFSKIAENPDVSYRQLAQGVLQTYAADNRKKPTPLFEGELDAAVFGMRAGDFIQQWRIDVKPAGITIPAGMLHRLSPGTKLAVLPSPQSEMTDALGYLEVRSAQNLTSTVAPVAHNDLARLNPADIPAVAYARLAELAVDFRLTVARAETTAAHAAEAEAVNAILEAVAADDTSGASLAIVEPGQSADLKLAVMSEADVAALTGEATSMGFAAAGERPLLWLLPATAEISLETGQRPPSIALPVPGAEEEEALPGVASASAAPPMTPERLTDVLGETLTKVYRATSLARLASANDFRAEEVSVEFMLKPAGGAEMRPLLPGEVPFAHPDDEIHLVARNGSAKPVDLNVLYVGSDYSITHIEALRLHSGDEITPGLLRFTDQSFGRERMIAVLTSAEPLTPVEDLSFLGQPGVPERTRTIGLSGFTALLQEIGEGPGTRSIMRLGDAKGPQGAVMIFEIDTRPA